MKGLSEKHASELRDGSGLSADVIKARGYRTVTEPDDLLTLGFSRSQASAAPGLLVPSLDVEGGKHYQFKPEKPRRLKKDKPAKYETAKGARVHIDVPPAAASSLTDPTVPLYITEGAKKADAAVTAGLCCVSLSGVDCWRRRNGDGESRPLKDWDAIKLDGREVYVAYDSDAMVKTSVQNALDGLTTFLRTRGARVAWVVLPPVDGLAGPEKVGLDDWLVAHKMDATGLAEHIETPRVVIRTNGVATPVLTRQAIAALHAANTPERLFTRDGLVVEAQGVGVTEMTKDRLAFLLSESADWYRATGGEQMTRTHVAPPGYVRDNVLAAGPDLWRLNRLDRIVTTPVFANDGTLRTTPGYHRASRSYYMPPEGLSVPPVSSAPKKVELKEAKALIDELFRDFVFVDDPDRAHAWALLLQPFAREMIRGETPLYSVQAPKAGTGKTKLVMSALAAAVGSARSQAEPHGDEEMEKRLTALMREAAPVVFFDNVDRFVSYPSLASVLTTPTWSGRVLGKSETVSLPVQATFVMTANNPTFNEDLKRRVVPVRLDARVEDPSRRTDFAHSLPAWALANRGRLVWAACTVVAAWVAASRPEPATGTPTLGSYGPWRRVLGGILSHAGIRGFLGNLHDRDANKSPDAETFEAVQDYAVSEYRSHWFYAKDLADVLDRDEVELAFFGRTPRSGPELRDALGKFLRKQKDQRVNGYVLERGERRQGPGFPWRFARVDQGGKGH